jgi:hypothetical protein
MTGRGAAPIAVGGGMTTWITGGACMQRPKGEDFSASYQTHVAHFMVCSALVR